MTFARRVSAFFLVALAIALAGYSAIFYFAARRYLFEQFDTRLHAAMDILAASVEVETDDAKWQPQEHGIRLDRDVLIESRWIVTDENANVVDRSPGLPPRDAVYASLFKYASQAHGDTNEPVQIDEWRILQRQLDAPAPKPLAEREPHEFASVRITVARSAAALHRTVRQLGLAMVFLPTAVWVIAAALGGWYIRRTLQPVRAMAERARSIHAENFSRRLPIGPSRDELSALGEEFNKLLDRLQGAYERQRQFTGNAAHQLRTPLAVLQGEIDVTIRRERTPEEYQRTLQVLRGKVGELSRIVESLLFLARTEADATIPRSDRIAINEWLAAYTARWSSHARAADFSLALGKDASLSTSTPLLSQLLDNLVQNAFAYSPPGSPVVLRSAAGDDQITLTVEDAGAGIAEDELPSIFSPFFRSAEARRSGTVGTGLGLAIAARIASALGGKLTCRSRVGEGSIFTLTLPADTTEK